MSLKTNGNISTSAEAGADTLQTPGGRVRGPVEEVIAKRSKQLGKKALRIKAYDTTPASKLNADQLAAQKTLPALEGAQRELEDLIKDNGVVQEVEIIQASRLREAVDATRKEERASAERKVEQYQTELSTSLPHFLRLHTLLCPPRPASDPSFDSQSYLFGQLDLPHYLQDEVRASDVLAVKGTWERLLAGGEGAKSVLASLVKPSEDENEQRIHHLISLLASPPASNGAAQSGADDSVTHNTTAPVAVAGEPTDLAPPIDSLHLTSRATAVDHTFISPQTLSESPYTAPANEPAPSSTTAAEPSVQAVAARSGVLNFLQADELAEATPAPIHHAAENDDVEPEPLGVDESYEMVQSDVPVDQTALQQAFQAKSLTADDLVAPAVGTASTAGHAVPATTMQTQDRPETRRQKTWAEMDDDEDEERLDLAASGAGSARGAAATEEQVVPSAGGPGLAVAQETAQLIPESAAGGSVGDEPTGGASAARGEGAGRGFRGGRGSFRRGRAAAPGQGQPSGRGGREGRNGRGDRGPSGAHHANGHAHPLAQAAQAQQQGRGKVVDDEGWETKVSRRPAAVSAAVEGGRGGFAGRGRGASGRGGRGGAVGLSRDGAERQERGERGEGREGREGRGGRGGRGRGGSRPNGNGPAPRAEGDGAGQRQVSSQVSTQTQKPLPPVPAAAGADGA